PDAGSYILLTFDGRRSEVEDSVNRIRELALNTGALEYIPLDDPDYAADIWKVRGALVKAVEATSEQEPVDIVVPINKTAEFIRFVNSVEKESGVRMVSFGHAGDGNVHLCVVRGERGDDEWQTALHGAMTKIYGKAYELGGITSGEHGIGISKREYFLRETRSENIAVMNRIKDALDPLHILNDKKSYIISKGG
ncbi:MAG: 2-hydroxy-acid oxidase, partial [Oscillospiraceae bacterium]|nr:2-hydroxy-acid oxidase [Oscillospiraceae bacterium]